MVTLREAELRDADSIRAIDTSFTTETIYYVSLNTSSMSLELTTLAEPLEKHYRIQELAQPKPTGLSIVALIDDRICGYLEAEYVQWNRRLVVRHLYVDRPRRRNGIARLLLNHAHSFGIVHGALVIWLETSNVNVPGIQAYLQLGYGLCGLDVTLYSGTASAGEVGLFFSRVALQ